jgi:hypothetical protein
MSPIPSVVPRPQDVIRRGFFRNDSLDFRTRSLLGQAVHGGSEVGEVLATISRVSSEADWVREWTAVARRADAAADQARSAGHVVSAMSSYRRAASYWAAVVDGLSTADDATALLAAFRAHRASWDAALGCSGGAHVRADVPYEGGQLPGYLLRPDATGAPRPTVVITNGSDGALSDLWSPTIGGALDRGWNAFVYDGPGQQSMLFERDTPFRPDWENVLTPVLDALVARADVDADRMVGYGVSQAGYWLPRALSAEHRLKAAVIDPGVVDVSASWTKQLGKSMTAMLDGGDRAKFTKYFELALKIPGLRRTVTFRARPYRYTDWFDLYQQVRQYRITPEIAAAIETPMLLTDPEDEQFWPGQSRALATMAPGRVDLVAFSADEGANFHCQPMGRLLTESRMFDWLEQFVTAPARG